MEQVHKVEFSGTRNQPNSKLNKALFYFFSEYMIADACQNTICLVPHISNIIWNILRVDDSFSSFNIESPILLDFCNTAM